MNIRKSILPALVMFAVLALPTPAFAVQGSMMTYVNAVLLSSTPQPSPATGLMWGGCMAYLANPITSFSNSPNCPDQWVSFSCDGTYATQSIAQMMVDQAQLAFATQQKVFVVVDDTKLENGYCTATRIDVWH
ncbi:MAG: hypothetical protein DM484_06590 [Candidatus Methylumidiphilus alinenensis]|uniref:Uncharacterized protein n=1 Tax=Candidatus Methylumidiphilus alinenensis TaxID=2202197 RepID=A0A2W4RE36_9GAMM|nr:MAG: hypothetical protein DM484_06590 [Candidatus Methylumidiphilus alinenensis]